MPLETQNIEILFEGLEQKTEGKVLKAGKLTRAQNVEFNKSGEMTKRRGYLRYRFDGTTQIGALGTTMETQAIRVCSHEDELLIFGVSWLWSLGSKTSGLDARAAVRRGRIAACNVRVWNLATAGEGRE